MRISDWSSDVCSSDLSAAEQASVAVSSARIFIGGAFYANRDRSQRREKLAHRFEFAQHRHFRQAGYHATTVAFTDDARIAEHQQTAIDGITNKPARALQQNDDRLRTPPPD